MAFSPCCSREDDARYIMVALRVSRRASNLRSFNWGDKEAAAKGSSVQLPSPPLPVNAGRDLAHGKFWVASCTNQLGDSFIVMKAVTDEESLLLKQEVGMMGKENISPNSATWFKLSKCP
ncbi:hypothetical protein L3Q82_004571 [Scortum barcoo]|uniref:Uncharacterized protein n=1 Tax=Scortum barcoo TaxID=214431 RepID=A0ACB8VGN0_9TELE|nr:hypothetical protein L3Q82_004571 [Scortum barcoo]